MSYIIAFVSSQDSSTEFPVQCFRTDLKVGDNVIVRRSDGNLRNLKITQLRYLNWECKGHIECKIEECSIDMNGDIKLPTNSPIYVGLSTPEEFINTLKLSGWIPIRSRQKTYRAVLAKLNIDRISYILVRKNGVDIQVIDRVESDKIEPYSFYNRSLNEGVFVRHFLAHTTFNIYYGLMRFSNSFINNERDITRFFVSQGSSDKRTDELKKQADNLQTERSRMLREQRDEMLDIYDACSNGDGGPAYLGDGIWITSSGRTHDWGR